MQTAHHVVDLNAGHKRGRLRQRGFGSGTLKPEELIGSFKSVTSRQLVKLIEENLQESRREWLLNSFRKAGISNSNNTKNQFWQQHNQPIELWSNHVIQHKIDYTHNNPVVAGFVENDYEYLYSSARDYAGIKGLVNVIVD
jgi:putative transposase